LRGANLGQDTSYIRGKSVAVVGGGNVAIDVARTALRLGAAEVHIVYRRRREDMPAYKEEVDQADEEGVKMHFLLSPIAVIGENGHVTGLRCQRMKLEQENEAGEKHPVFDNSGRKRPFPIEGAEFTLPVDVVIPAIGQTTDTSYLGESTDIQVNRSGAVVADPRTFATNVPGIFAGGDAALGPASIVEAVATANKAARAIDRYLQGEPLQTPATIMDRPEGVEKPEISEEDGARPRQSAPMRPVAERVCDFGEVEAVFPRDSALLEARRCLACDLEKMS